MVLCKCARATDLVLSQNRLCRLSQICVECFEIRFILFPRETIVNADVPSREKGRRAKQRHGFGRHLDELLLDNETFQKALF